MQWPTWSGCRLARWGSRNRLTVELLGLANGVEQRAHLEGAAGHVTVSYRRAGDRLTFTVDGPADHVRVQLAFGEVERVDNGRLLSRRREATVEWDDVHRPLVVTLWH